jgi:hypothetical protein
MSASPTPSPERIELCTPPDSPSLKTCAQFSASGTLDLQAAIRTPPRAPQGVHPRRGVKRRRPDSDPADGHTDMAGCDDSADVFGDYSTGPVGDSSRAVVSDDLGRTIGSGASDVFTQYGMDSFEHYADAVLADCAGFFQISKILFVVQGWDPKRQRSMVSLYA